jgi:hypothetical protein
MFITLLLGFLFFLLFHEIHKISLANSKLESFKILMHECIYNNLEAKVHPSQLFKVLPDKIKV